MSILFPFSFASQKLQDKYAVTSVKSRTASLPQSEFGHRHPVCSQTFLVHVRFFFNIFNLSPHPPTADFTVRDSPPQFVIPTSTSLPVVTLKERKDTPTHPGSPSGSVPNSDRSSSSQAVLLYKETVLVRGGGVHGFPTFVFLVTVS